MIGTYILVGLGLIIYAYCFTVGAYFIYKLAHFISVCVRDILLRWSDNRVKRKEIRYGNKKNKDN